MRGALKLPRTLLESFTDQAAPYHFEKNNIVGTVKLQSEENIWDQKLQSVPKTL